MPCIHYFYLIFYIIKLQHCVYTIAMHNEIFYFIKLGVSNK